MRRSFQRDIKQARFRDGRLSFFEGKRHYTGEWNEQ
ncbi:MAG: DUF1460 domain-containing protein [Roseibium sp.]|nr:DUF1460 domain-containing protein [Roseibium sp.]